MKIQQLLRVLIFLKKGRTHSLVKEGLINSPHQIQGRKDYYFADIEGDKGFALLIVFSEEDNRAYLENISPVRLGKYKYHAIFVEKFVNRDYWEAAMSN